MQFFLSSVKETENVSEENRNSRKIKTGKNCHLPVSGNLFR